MMVHCPEFEVLHTVDGLWREYTWACYSERDFRKKEKKLSSATEAAVLAGLV